MTRWVSMGLVFYISLYTGFYFLHHLSVDHSGVLQQYAKELSFCWHDTSSSTGTHPNITIETKANFYHAVHWPVELSLNPQSEGKGEGGATPYQGVRRFPRRVWATVNASVDAGDCIAEPGSLRGTTSGVGVGVGGVGGVGGMAGVGSVRCLPSFMIIGAMKSGTGELMKWLQVHPQIESGKGTSGEGEKREIRFFTQHNTHGDSLGDHGNSIGNSTQTHTGQSAHHYAQHFRAMSLPEAQNVYTFDKSPDYIRSPQALRRIRQLLPSAQLVLLLRDPVTRVLSEFRHHCRCAY
ncbi:P-loop containing nucleoside triphosphate hydrolase protein [Ochromonadaceae sp. CCMP2298]|nr:P-loop containing nucleoside triphosphate hydrolase protein [Ochromonadaceae sp. CCMP2298]